MIRDNAFRPHKSLDVEAVGGGRYRKARSVYNIIYRDTTAADYKCVYYILLYNNVETVKINIYMCVCVCVQRVIRCIIINTSALFSGRYYLPNVSNEIIITRVVGTIIGGYLWSLCKMYIT